MTFDLEQQTLAYQKNLDNDPLPSILRAMILTMYYRRTRRGGGFFCAYSGNKITRKTDKTEQEDIYTCDHILPKSLGRQLNENPHNLQALAWKANDHKSTEINLHAQCKAAQLGVTGIGIRDFREDFDEFLFVFDLRVKQGNIVEALPNLWPINWRKTKSPYRPFIPMYDEQKGEFLSLEESIRLDEAIRAGHMLEWKESCTDLKRVNAVWQEYEKRFGISPEEAAAWMR
jgi:hypothetical protein